MKIVLAIDSFKDCLSSIEVEAAAEAGIKLVSPSANVVSVPVSDGGEGLLESFMTSDPTMKRVSINAHDALMRPIVADYGISNDTAIIEMASTCGLSLLSVSERNPLNTTSFGLGEMMKDAITRGCNKLIVGIGGSATNDAGIGMLMALGYSFKDSAGQSLDGIGSDLSKVTDILSPAITDTYRHVSITVASDVDNPLYGQKGAAFVFGPQKGANALMVSQLNSGLQHFAQIVSSSVGKNCAFEKGSGAAGGVGYAFKCFFNNCKFISGIEFILDYIDFDRIVNGANLIITGEGKIDNQTMMGKVAIGVLKRAVQKNIPVIAIAGKVEDKSDLMQKGFKDIVCINPDGISNEEALKKDYACSNIKETVGKLLRTNHF